MIADFESGGAGAVSRFLHRLFLEIGDWHIRRREAENRRRSMSVVAGLDDHLICDLGLSRAQIEAEATLPRRPRLLRVPLI